MSATTTPAATPSPRDQAIADAKNLPTLINNLSAADPALAEQLTGKALIASKTPWGTLAGGIVGFLVARYGLGWDQGTQTLVAGAGVLVGSYIMRWITTSPITSMIKSKV